MPSATDWRKPTAVYRLFDAAGKLLYVGMTHDLERRFYTHSRTQPWWPQVAARDITWYEDRETANDAETIAIAIEKPRFNLNPKNGPVTDLSTWLGLQGIFQPHRDELVAVAMAATSLPPRVQAIIGLPDDVLAFHSRHVYLRNGERLWCASSWQYLGRRGTVKEPRDQKFSVMLRGTRFASPFESQALGVPVPSVVDTWDFTSRGSWGDRATLVEAAWPTGQRADCRRVTPNMLLAEMTSIGIRQIKMRNMSELARAGASVTARPA